MTTTATSTDLVCYYYCFAFYTLLFHCLLTRFLSTTDAQKRGRLLKGGVPWRDARNFVEEVRRVVLIRKQFYYADYTGNYVKDRPDDTGQLAACQLSC